MIIRLRNLLKVVTDRCFMFKGSPGIEPIIFAFNLLSQENVCYSVSRNINTTIELFITVSIVLIIVLIDYPSSVKYTADR